MIAVAKYQIMPPLSADDLAALESSILARGVLVPVEYDENGEIIDGHHRVFICEKHRLSWPRKVRSGLTELEKRAVARQLNLARRHLSTAQKRQIVEAQLTDTPEYSNRMIAALIGVDKQTVGTHRASLEEKGSLQTPIKVVGLDGHWQRASRRTVVDPWRSISLRNGEIVGNLNWYEIQTIIRDNERDNQLLNALYRHCVINDQSVKVRDVVPYDVVASISEASDE